MDLNHEAKNTMVNPQNFQPPKFFHPPQGGDIINNNGRIYFVGQVIGKGSFGNVYECTDEWENELVAKVILPLNRTYEEVKHEWIEELNKLEYLRHPNITYIYDAFECNDTFYLIIERCYCTLKDILSIPNNNGEIWLPYVAKDLLQGVDYIHSAGYVHKDIHPGNVFISKLQRSMLPTQDNIFMFKLGDLGISRLEGDINIFNTILAKWMLPPEFFEPRYGRIGRQVDIYHTGLLLLSLLLGHIPQFTPKEICAGKPREMAEKLASPYGYAIGKALRRHVARRPESALDFWREISEASKSQQ